MMPLFILYILTHRGKLSLELADNLGEKFSKQYGIDNDTTVAVDTMQITLVYHRDLRNTIEIGYKLQHVVRSGTKLWM